MMFRTTLSLIALVPAVLAAQVAGSGAGQTKANAQAGKTASAGGEVAASVDVELAAARAKGLPEAPITKRVAEGKAKGATDEQLAAAAQRLRLNMESAVEAMASAGRKPSGEEIERAAYAMERGYAAADIQAVAKSAPADRSLVVAFDVLARLQESGAGTAESLAQVQSKLESKADDAAIDALASVKADAAVKAVAPAVDTKAAAGAAAKVGGAATGVTKKP